MSRREARRAVAIEASERFRYGPMLEARWLGVSQECYLRPQRAGVVFGGSYLGNREWYTQGGNTYGIHLTRAQAAQAAYKAHKEAEKKIRSMMPSVSYSWTEDAQA